MVLTDYQQSCLDQAHTVVVDRLHLFPVLLNTAAADPATPAAQTAPAARHVHTVSHELVL